MPKGKKPASVDADADARCAPPHSCRSFLSSRCCSFRWQMAAAEVRPAARAAPFRIAITALSRGCSASGSACIGNAAARKRALLLANHSSWLDIVIFSAVAPLSFVAKSEVNSWPFFGTLARLQRTVFVDRARRSETGAARDAIRERLAAGDALVLFPEGTSNDGNRSCRSRARCWRRAEAVLEDGRQVPVQPVSTAYVGAPRHSDGAREPAALCLVWRHGTGAASVGGADRPGRWMWWSSSMTPCRPWTARNWRASPGKRCARPGRCAGRALSMRARATARSPARRQLPLPPE